MNNKTLLTLSLLIAAITTMTSCSNEDESVSNDNNRIWKVSINASSAAETRAISIGGNTGNRLYYNWDDGDAVEVVKDGVSKGTLTANMSAGNTAYATLEGTLTGNYNVGDAVKLYYHSANLDYTGQIGTFAGVSANTSYLEGSSSVQAVNLGSGDIQDASGYLTMSGATFSPMQAYLELNFITENGLPLEISQLDIYADGGKLVKTKAIDGTTTYATSDAPLTITPAAPTSKFFIALRDENGAANNYHFIANVGGNSFIYEGSKNLQYGHYYKGNVTMTYPVLATPLTFQAKEAGAVVTFSWYNAAPGEVQYSTDGSTWMDYTSATPITLANVGDKVMFRGTKNSSYGPTAPYTPCISCSADCYVFGNIMSLYYRDDFATITEMGGKSFRYFFWENTHLLSHDLIPLVLPATTLSYGCYQEMFWNCTSLTTAPELPATDLSINDARSCYQGMFRGCTSLTTAPALPATTVSNDCYNDMFNGCTSLTTAPELPATNLSNVSNCYKYMFYGCTSLTTAPELPATTLGYGCYYGMFEGCTFLTTAPALPATTLAACCYTDMFKDCTSLTTAPVLPATTLNVDCYCGMFAGCANLTTAPALPATTLASGCYQYMFQGCTNLYTAPLLPATQMEEMCYSYMFSYCRNLNSVTCLAKTNFEAASCINHMLYRVSESGTININSDLDPDNPAPWTKDNIYGIPTSWDIQRYNP